MGPLLVLLLHLLAFVSSSASNPTSFCKCICGPNNTIIPLDAPSSLHARDLFPQPNDLTHMRPLLRREEQEDIGSPTNADDQEAKEGGDETQPDKSADKDPGGEKKKEYRKKTCSDCNKQYCLSQGLHICEGKALEDIFTTCFQRDSRKDEAVVFLFIFATAALLGWAAMKPWIDVRSPLSLFPSPPKVPSSPGSPIFFSHFSPSLASTSFALGYLHHQPHHTHL
ncbi:hypothetical protein XPA_006895 [Xanthoria parietina]